MAKLSEVHVGFRLASDALLPGEVTRRLNVEPTRSHRKGEQHGRNRKTGEPIIYRSGIWILDSALPESAGLVAHVESLLDVLYPIRHAVQCLVEQGYQADFTCGLFLNHENEGVSIPARTLARIAELGAELSLDIYSPVDGDGDNDRPPV